MFPVFSGQVLTMGKPWRCCGTVCASFRASCGFSGGALTRRERRPRRDILSQAPPLVGTLRWGKVVSCAQGPSHGDEEAIALLRGRVCFVLGQLRPGGALTRRERRPRRDILSQAPPLVRTLRWGKCVSCAQGPSTDNGKAVALLRAVCASFRPVAASQVLRS